jgi:hypothetical protein
MQRKHNSKGELQGSLLPVSQEHLLGCGVACVASRCGITYKDALSLFSHPEHAWTRGYYCEEMVEALKSAGFFYSFARFDPTDAGNKIARLLKIPGTIAFQERCEEYPHGHFFVRTSSGWMNPWSNFPWMDEIKSEIQPEIAGNISFVIFETGFLKSRSTKNSN